MTQILAGQTAPNRTLKGHKLLLLSPWRFSEADLDELRRLFPGLKVASYQFAWSFDTPQEDFPPDEWKDVTILLTGRALPTREQAPRLRCVQLVSAGANQVLDKPIFTETDIVFATANGVHGPQISEWIIGTFLAFQHRIPQYLEQQRQGKWVRGSEGVEESAGKRVGILGYGSIGRQTARVATALGLEVYAYTLHPRPTPESRRDHSYHPPGLGDPDGSFPTRWFSGSSTAELHAFLSSGLDLLVIAAPLTSSTRHLIGAAELELLGKRAFVSNIARGPLISTDDLVKALDGDVIAGAALDVTDPEPLTEGHPLWTTKNVIITPHVSGESKNYNKRVFAILKVNLGRLSEGKELINVVSRKEGY